MSVRWLTAFVDVPAGVHDAATRFWCEVTASGRSPVRGERGQFATLVPADGDAYLRVQRVVDGPGAVHLDVHVDDVPEAVERVVALGATIVDEERHILASPSGFVFCVVGHHGEAVRPAPVIGPGGTSSRLDQLCVDVPAVHLDEEHAFWAAVTGWQRRQLGDEFTLLRPPAGQPLRLLLQRLGADDAATSSRAHLDFACGGHVERAAAWHERLGARVVQRHHPWTTLTDPAGLVYCLTPRDPVTGVRAGFRATERDNSGRGAG